MNVAPPTNESSRDDQANNKHVHARRALVSQNAKLPGLDIGLCFHRGSSSHRVVRGYIRGVIHYQPVAVRRWTICGITVVLQQQRCITFPCSCLWWGQNTTTKNVRDLKHGWVVVVNLSMKPPASVQWKAENHWSVKPLTACLYRHMSTRSASSSTTLSL